MVILIESIVGCLLFTIIFGGMTYLKPLSMIHDYPPAIQNKAKELGLITDEQKEYNKTDIKGFGYSYLLWNIVKWWDAIKLFYLKIKEQS